MFLTAQCMEAVLGPGDLIYYPPGYWHQTTIVEASGSSPAVALSSTVVPSEHYAQKMLAFIAQECAHSGNVAGFEFSPNICDHFRIG
jgi:ribosomal protein L16 Arg81 hydroxylase